MAQASVCRRTGEQFGTVTKFKRTSPPLISVILCTRNRSDLLRKAITSVVIQRVPRTSYEIVVVDNGSTDDTPRLVHELRDSTEIHYLREDRIGLCIARNAGWQAASGEYVAFLDDDAIALPNWLKMILEVFTSNAASVAAIGGRVEPIWEAARPAWLADDIARALTIIDWGTSQKIIQNISCEWLAGANIAVRKSVLTEIGGFHPWLDRVGSNLLSSGDVFLQKEIMRRGYHCLYVPDLAVEHLVPRSRLSQHWFLRRFFWQGVSNAVMHLIEKVPSRGERVLTSLSKAGRLLLWSRREVRALAFPTEEPLAFKAKCYALMDLGFTLGLLGAAKH